MVVISYVGLEHANMQPRASVGDGFRVSASSTPSNSSGGSEPDDIDSFHAVYIWGEVLANGVSPDGIGTQIPSKTDVLIPKALESNVVLDVCHIATGAHHIAIATRQGHVFTWGQESGGRLGHGIDKDFSSPVLVEFLEGNNFEFVACGEYHTSALSKSFELYTWGDGTHNVGLLGHGSEASHWIPKMVNGPLEGLQVVSIACGTWHSALATSNGKLFTFGDGAFGVLGHGDQESVWYPKEVQLLTGLKTIKVACGVWHTAAIIEVAFQSGSNSSSWKLFTWGDGDMHRLGHGNKETYLQPTRVAPLMEYNFHQVECGHNMTIALTTSGHVFTMGGTEHGQLGNPMSLGKIPTLVQDKLLGEFVEKISCGAHHVAILTNKSEIYTWGMGANGRLGHGDVEDRKSPTLVVALKDRNIKNVSCGSNFTSCICVHKWVSETDQSIYNGFRQAFGLTKKRHNCHNCGLACSSKKTLKATTLTPTPEKPHRVCDNCNVKLKVVNDNGASKLDRKVTPSHHSINGNERLGQGTIRSTRTLLSPITEPIKYLEIKNSNPKNKFDSTSFIRASQVPSHVQLKDIAFPSSLSSSQSVLKSTIPLASPPRTPPPHTNSGPIFTNTRKQSPTRLASPRYFGSLNNNLRRTNDALNQEVSKLQNQIQSLKQRSDMQDVEIKKLNKKVVEAIAFSAVESSNHGVTKEFFESTVYQLKEITEKLPQKIPESKTLRIVLTQAEDFLKGILESKTSSSSKLESKQPNAPDIPNLNNGSSNLQKNRVEENVDIAGVNPCQDEGKFLEESNISNLQPKKQNALDIATLDGVCSKLQKQRIQENMEANGANPCHDEESFLEESNKSKLDYRKQNIPTSDTSTSKMREHKLDKNVDDVELDSCQDREILLEESSETNLDIKYQNAPNMLASISDVSEFQDDKLEENVEVARVDPSQAEGHIPQECNGSFASSVCKIMPSQNSYNDSRSMDTSRLGKQGEIQVIEKFERGVYVILMLQSDGTKIFKRVKFR
ncbi:PH, RCC1 and FYVE domains-containing protein 1-like [Glycine soja]|nr:PH, RCC1 and FYVE domains-containing protein 1-like [Glycine soja]